MSLLHRIAPKLTEAFELPINRSRPDLDWKTVQAGGQTPEQRFIANRSKTFGVENKDPKGLHKANQEIMDREERIREARAIAKRLRRSKMLTQSGFSSSRRATASSPEPSPKPASGSGLHHSEQDIEAKVNDSDKVQKRIDAVRAKFSRNPNFLNSLSRGY